MNEPDHPTSAWTELDDDAYEQVWNRFYDRFDFRAGIEPQDWPGIREPTPSWTFDLSAIPEGPRGAAAYDSINAEALRAFLWALPQETDLLALDWQHSAYRFRPADHALDLARQWEISVHPNGDYYAFLTEDLSTGTFGHPWEQTLCVIGDAMIDTLGRSLQTWLPIIRINGVASER